MVSTQQRLLRSKAGRLNFTVQASMKQKIKKPISKGDELMKKYHNGESVAESFSRQMRELQLVINEPLTVTKLLKSNKANATN